MSVDTPRWVRDAVFYQIFPDRFASSPRVPKPGVMEDWDAPPTYHGYKGGDLLGIVDRLDDLVDLGVTALYLTPIFTSASNHRYHTDDYLHVDPLLGGDDALRELLDSAHARDMRVVLDGVFNHCGRGFLPFHHIVEAGVGSPYRDWFHLDPARTATGLPLVAYPEPHAVDEIHRLEAEGVGPGEASRRVLGYEGWWGLPALPKLNLGHPDTRAHLLDVAEHWLRAGIDGWRLDVAEEIGGDFWEEFRARCRAVSPDAYLVAEVWHAKPEWLTGRHFDAFMNYPLAQAILGYAPGEHLDLPLALRHDEYRRHLVRRDGAAFAAELERLLASTDPDVTAVQLNLLDSHDTARFLTMARGDVASLRLATLLQMTLPGAPCVYYGDEVGLEGGHDPDNRRAFPWDRSRWDHGLRAYVRALIGLRRRHQALRDGELAVVGATGGAFAMARRGAGERFVVATNADAEGRRLEVTLPEGWGPVEGGALVELGEAMGDDVGAWCSTSDGRLRIGIPPRGGAIVRIE